MYQNVFDNYNVKPRRSLLKIVTITLSVTLLLIFVIALIQVFRTADKLIETQAKNSDELANNLMPAHDSISFSLHREAPELNGMFFRAKQWPAKANVIFVPDRHTDHLQYGLKTAEVFNFFINHGYNVLAYDPQGTGKSAGDVSTYGYVEYRDVLAAMSACKRISGFTDFVLYGVGSGNNASLFAWSNLPEEPLPEDEQKGEWIDIDFSKQDIRAFICDTPIATVKDAIQADLPADNIWDQKILRPFVPWAVRISTGSGNPDNLLQLYTRIQIPMFLTTNNPDSKYDNVSIKKVIRERERLVPAMTDVLSIDKEGHLESWQAEKDELREKLRIFLERWITVDR